MQYPQDQDACRPPSNDDTTDELIRRLSCRDGAIRRQARSLLARRSAAALPGLVHALTTGPDLERWEASKTLRMIAHPSSAPALVRAMRLDDDYGVRWNAAEALIAMGRKGLPPLLIALANYSQSVWLRQGAHHVVSELTHHGEVPEVAAVLRAFDHPDAEDELPMVAFEVLRSLTQHQTTPPRAAPE